MTKEQGRIAWTEQALSVWGKSCRGDDRVWLPLVQHLADAAAVAGLMWDRWLPSATKQLIDDSLPGGRGGKVLVSWLAGIHDIGKVSPAFAVQVGHLAEGMRRVGLDCPVVLPNRRLAHHTLVGHHVVRQWLKERHGLPPRFAGTYADPVGAHHGLPPDERLLADIPGRGDLLGRDAWHQVRIEILDAVSQVTGAAACLPTWASGPLPGRVLFVVSGIVTLADWLASDEQRFPYGDPVSDGKERAERAWTTLALPGPWSPSTLPADPDQALWDRFPRLAGRSARPLQRWCADLAAATPGPSLMIVEAPMGTGKTEAALLAAETLARHGGHGGVFFGLPTMATSDAMFARVLDWIGRQPGGETTVTLAHSKAGLNDAYRGLLRSGTTLSSVCDETQSGTRAEAVALSWLSGRRKGALANFVVGTIDQALFLALYSRFVALRHLAMVGKVVVIDEVHAADDYMRVYLTRVLEWLAACRVPVVLMSATLPSAQRLELAQAYASGLKMVVELEPDPPYPLITQVSAAGAVMHSPGQDGDCARVSLVDLGESAEDLGDFLDSRLADGGCAAVVRNTVRRAQDTYRQLVERWGPDQVVLLHSRFLAPARALTETRLRNLLGPPEASDRERPTRLIVVGTQVLEQSLDVDFDLMVSDIAPVDLVLQRMGRLHRHDRPYRPPGGRLPVLGLTGIASRDQDGVPQFEQGSVAIYGESRLLRSVSALGLASSAESTVVLPDDVRHLVESAYAVDPDVPVSWGMRVRDADADYAKGLAADRLAASAYCFGPVPPPGNSLVRFWRSATETDEDRHGAAAVRDSEDTFEVAVVQRHGPDDVRLLDGDFPFAGSRLPASIGAPDSALARAVAGCTVRLPVEVCRWQQGDASLAELERAGYANWQESPWLAGLLVLTLDQEGKATLGNFDIEYDRRLGLVTSRRCSSAG